jgi:hydroxymethylglutaryl-CoA synthase
MREAIEDYESAVGPIHPEDYVLGPFHTPFPGMVRKAAALAYRHFTRGTEIEEQLAAEIGRQPRREEFDSEEAFREAAGEYTDDLTDTDRYKTWYAECVDPTLTLSREVGNWYTGSVHVARVSGLKAALEDGQNLTGGRMLVGSYGSGAQAEVHAETIQAGWAEEISALDIDEQLESRYELDFEEYERVHDVHNHDEDAGVSDVEQFTQPDGEFVFDGWGRMGERKYTYVA